MEKKFESFVRDTDATTAYGRLRGEPAHEDDGQAH